ncbi:StAR-related lipid transfer protein 6 [Pteropus alecto]|uniref:StAR-related lipid transfer protein 6 n=1 Tax=Pteropus alecto TaxID=9402 RepID=L5K4A5_PTEAL|nr:StAR-related lipid transfer protein 6 [Pteropus alecto]
MCEPVYKAGSGYEVRRIRFQSSGVSKKDAISALVYVYFPLTQWVKISLITPPENVPGHPMLHHQDTFICHSITQSFAMGSISPRDFIDLVYFKRYEGNVNVISSKSVDFPAYPPSSNYIRGYNHACGYICSPLQENPAHSKLVMFVQTDMRGKLSPSVIEATMPSNLVSFILNAKDGIKTHKATVGRGCHHNGHSSPLKKK